MNILLLLSYFNLKLNITFINYLLSTQRIAQLYICLNFLLQIYIKKI